MRGFAGGPVGKTSASHAGGASSMPGRELKFHMPHSQNIKTKSRGNILTVSKKTLKKWSTSKTILKKYRLIQTKYPIGIYCTAQGIYSIFYNSSNWHRMQKNLNHYVVPLKLTQYYK